MEACESIEKAEDVDRYASMSFKNATRGYVALSCVLTMLQIQIHIRKKLLLLTTPSTWYFMQQSVKM